MLSQDCNGAAVLPGNAIPEGRILDAAYDLLLAVGMRRMTMADVARRAEVSRATLYRRWANVREIVGALITREWSAMDAKMLAAEAPHGRARLVNGVVALVAASRAHPILRKIIELDPEFLLPYLLRRRGSSTEHQLATIEAALRAGIEDGSIAPGPGDPAARAQAVLLAAWSFALTGPAISTDLDVLDEQLRTLLERYLTP
ncbi:MAG TPA: helix-turn-helix domain-containing protein [Pseudonocardiaceae bacterium]